MCAKWAIVTRLASAAPYQPGAPASEITVAPSLAHLGIARLARLRRSISARSASEGDSGPPLAGASGSFGQTTSIVTPSLRPLVSAAVLLELARWCQQRLACTEVGNPCDDTQLDQQSPPFGCPSHDAQEAGGSALATVGPGHTAGAPGSSDADDRAPHPEAVRKRRKGGSR